MAFPPERSERSRDTDYNIYFAYAEELSRVKIGVTIGPPQHRVNEIEIASPCAIREILCLRGHSLLERHLHAMFDCYRLRREWFRYEGELRKFVENPQRIVPHNPRFLWTRTVEINDGPSVEVGVFMDRLVRVTRGSELGEVARALNRSLKYMINDLQKACFTEAEFSVWRERLGDCYARTEEWFREGDHSVPTSGTRSAGLAQSAP